MAAVDVLRSKGQVVGVVAAALAGSVVLSACRRESSTQDKPMPSAAAPAAVSAAPPPSETFAQPTTPGVDAKGRRACDGSKPAPLRLTRVASGLNQPLYVLSEPQNAGRLYVLEKEGRVKRVVDQARTETVLTLAVRSVSEMGLLGMAFHPRFGHNERRVYLSYVNSRGESILSEWRMPSEQIDPQSEKVLFRLEQPLPNHNGGMVLFGPDGFLYLGLGDGGGANDQLGHGQNRELPFAALLRFDTETPEKPVPGNLNGPGQDTRVFHHGLRNPWRFSFDAKTGDLFIGDPGQDDWEEVDVVPAGAPATNFGWPTFEGTHRCKRCKTNAPEPQPGMVMPVLEYQHRDGGASVTGGYVYRGKRIPSLEGRYLYADFVQNFVRAFTWNGQRVCDELDLTADLDQDKQLLGIASFGEDAAREVYVVSMIKGDVFRIEAE